MAEEEKTEMDEGKKEEPIPDGFPRTPPPSPTDSCGRLNSAIQTTAKA